MKIYLSDQRKRFLSHYHELRRHSIIPYQKNSLKKKVQQVTINQSFNQIAADNLFNYKIFPHTILTAFTQWQEENRSIQPGDIIVQQINIPPCNLLSQKIITGVRVKDVFDSNHCKGFSYETLEGHVERGISIFKIEPENDISVFTIETYSAPTTKLLNLFKHFSSLYQDYCTTKALKNIKNLLG